MHHTYLEEQHKRHPLIVTVIGSIIDVVAESTVRHIRTKFFAMLAGHRKRVRNPTVSVDHVSRYGSIINARNWITCEN